ncbi:MAG TPA: hypothetical protein VM600_08985, partial [Actinomycetota bacterium]|nr:hypothetical protein [Actinomycetota bacterium]
MRTTMKSTNGRRIAIAGLLVAIAAISGAANATVGAPTLLATSVDNQWAAGTGPIAARFDRELSEAGSSAELRDRTGYVYSGRLAVSASVGKEKDALVYYVQLAKDETMLEENSPYTIRFVAQSAVAGEGTTEVTRMFTLDATRPTA